MRFGCAQKTVRVRGVIMCKEGGKREIEECTNSRTLYVYFVQRAAFERRKLERSLRCGFFGKWECCIVEILTRFGLT